MRPGVSRPERDARDWREAHGESRLHVAPLARGELVSHPEGEGPVPPDTPLILEKGPCQPGRRDERWEERCRSLQHARAAENVFRMDALPAHPRRHDARPEVPGGVRADADI